MRHNLDDERKSQKKRTTKEKKNIISQIRNKDNI